MNKQTRRLTRDPFDSTKFKPGAGIEVKLKLKCAQREREKMKGKKRNACDIDGYEKHKAKN